MKIPAEKPASHQSSELTSAGRGRGSTTSHDIAVVGALDAICNSAEQTYEQMMESFMYLTHADVSMSGQSTAAAAASSAAAFMTPSSACSELSSLSDSCSLDEATPTVLQDARDVPSTVAADGDVLEEVLAEGTKTSSIWLRSKDVTGGMAVKVDNFVALEDSSDVEEDGFGYQASFASEGSKSDAGTKCNVDQPSHSTSCTTSDPKVRTEPSDSTENTASSAAQSRLQTVEDTASKCWAKFAGQKPSVIATSKQKEVWELLSDEDGTESDSDRETDHVKTAGCAESQAERVSNADSPLDETPDELDAQIEKLSECPASRSSDATDEADEGSTVVSDVPSLQGPISDEVNPGEVEEIIVCSESDLTHVSQLPFSARSAADGRDDGEPVAIATEEIRINSGICKDTSKTDDVEAFTLDEDFDYDNVVLTPKFSEAAEMAVLAAAMLRSEAQDQE